MMVDSDYISHHGILGMKWGIRRYQNPDGSLTPLGKEHYAKQGLTLKGKHSMSSYEGNKALSLQDDSEETKTEIARLKNTANKILEGENQAYDDAVKAVSGLEKNKAAMSQARSLMKQQLVSADEVDDRDLITLTAQDVAYEVATQIAPHTASGKKVVAYEKRLKDWYDDYSNTLNKIVSKHGDQIVDGYNLNTNKKATTTYRDIVNYTMSDSIGGRMFYSGKVNWFAEAMGNYEGADPTESFVKAIEQDFIASSTSLKHHGIRGQKWGVRRYQNADGSLTPAGKERYSKEQYRRDTAVYGHLGANRIAKRVNKKGWSVSEARSREASRINGARNRALVTGQIGSAVGAVGGGIGGFIASNIVSKRLAESGNMVLSDPTVRLMVASTVSAGSAKVAETLGRHGGRALGMATSGYSPNKYR